jgi:hypothetical protein
VCVQGTSETHRDAEWVKNELMPRVEKRVIKRRMQTKQKQKNGKSLCEASFVQTNRYQTKFFRKRNLIFFRFFT